MNASVLNISFTLSSKLLSKVCGVLIFDVLDNRIPASVVVDLITVAWGINNVES